MAGAKISKLDRDSGLYAKMQVVISRGQSRVR